jgi:YQGE family putative transporter
MVGKYCKKAIQNKVFFIGSVMCFLGTVVLVLFTNYFGVILNGVLTSVFTCFWSIPFTTIMYDIAGKSSEKSNNIADYMIVREIPTALGRISGIALYIVVSINFMDKTAIKLILPLLSFMVVLNYIYFNRREKEKLDVVV